MILQKSTRFGVLPIQDILPEIEYIIQYGDPPRPRNSKKKIVLLGHSVGVHSIRLALFKESPLVCVHCGLRASYFALERHDNSNEISPHLNLYGIDAEGNEVLFTKDHIIPVSKGGKDVLSNLQVLCIVCNMRKGDSTNTHTTKVST